jgi:hypothetical protein
MLLATSAGRRKPDELAGQPRRRRRDSAGTPTPPNVSGPLAFPHGPRQDGAAAYAVASGRELRVVGACACSWVAGVGPVEPHTEDADHDRL